MTIKITIKSKKVLNKLKKIGSQSEKVIGKALEESAKIVREEASFKASKRTGELARRLVISKVKHSSIDIGPDKKTFYGRFIELGTVKMSARPFLRPALDTKKNEVRAKFIEVLKRLLK